MFGFDPLNGDVWTWSCNGIRGRGGIKLPEIGFEQFPGRKSVFRVACVPIYSREMLKVGPPAGLRPAGGPIFVSSPLKSGEIRPGNPISCLEALLRSIEYYGALSTGRPIDGQSPQNFVNYMVLRGLPVDRSAR